MIQSWDDEKLNLKDKLLRGVFSYGFENQVRSKSKLFILLFMEEMV